MNDRPRIAVTMGDAAGIGPEIIVKALAGPAATERCIPIVLGDGGVLGRAMDLTGLRLPLRRIARPAEAEGRPGCLELIDHRRLDETAHRWGEVSAANGAAAVHYTQEAGRLALAGEVEGAGAHIERAGILSGVRGEGGAADVPGGFGQGADLVGNYAWQRAADGCQPLKSTEDYRRPADRDLLPAAGVLA